MKRIEVLPLYKDTALYSVSDVVHEGRVRHRKLTQVRDPGHSAPLEEKIQILEKAEPKRKVDRGRSFVQRHCFVRKRCSPRRTSSSPKTHSTPRRRPLRPTGRKNTDIRESRAQEKADGGRSFVLRHCFIRERCFPRRTSSSPKTHSNPRRRPPHRRQAEEGTVMFDTLGIMRRTGEEGGTIARLSREHTTVIHVAPLPHGSF